jgi:general secretion pathway protein D
MMHSWAALAGLFVGLSSAVAALNTTNQAGAERFSLNFHGAPLSQVLDYFSEAGGFVIHQAGGTQGLVDVYSKDPLSSDAAVDLLNSALKKDGYRVIRNRRILTVVSLRDAKASDLDVVIGNNPDAVQKSDEMVTQIIPVVYASASQLVNNLQPLLPSSASLSVNESANSLILVATKTDVRRMLEIIAALDNAIARVSSIKIYPLHYADATAIAAVVQQLFSPQGSSQNASNPRAQLFGPADGGGFGPPGFADATTASAGATSALKVVATSDERSNSLIVSASADLFPMLTSLVQRLDQQADETAQLRIFRLRHADPAEMADELAQVFPENSAGGTDQTALIAAGGPPGPPGADWAAAGDDSSASSARKRKGRVMAVADPRTSALLVSAAGTLMPQIARLIEQLDADPARNETVKVWDLKNADPQDVNQILKDLFQRNGATQNNDNANSMVGDNNPLTTRQTKQQSTTTTGTSTLGSSSAAGGSGSTGF